MQLFMNIIGITGVTAGLAVIVLLLIWLVEKKSLNRYEKRQGEMVNYYEEFQRIQEELSSIHEDIESLKTKSEQAVDVSFEEEGDRFRSVMSDTAGVMLEEVIRQNQNKAKRCNIFMTVEYQIRNLDGFRETEMVSLVDNLLRNAIESCERLPDDGDKRILFHMNRQGSNMIIHMENGKLQDMHPVENEFRTVKEDETAHGFGMGLIYQLVQRYQGTIQVEDIGKQLRIQIQLVGNQEVEESGK